MTKRKTGRRALLTSVMALAMCLVMLVGTTFAWFTDSVTSGVNVIKSGNLDVELQYKNTKDGALQDVADSTSIFREAALWEPGHVEYAVLQVSNVGTLALKYKLGINVAEETISKSVQGNELKLSEHLQFAVLKGDQSAKTRAELVALAEADAGKALLSAGYTAEGHLLAGEADASETVTLVVWMPTTVGNEANHAKDAVVPTIKLGITLVATQDTVESDSFDNQYDKLAEYPGSTTGDDTGDDPIGDDTTDEAEATPANSEELADFLRRTTAEEVTIYLGDETYTLPAISNKKVNFISIGRGTVIDMANSALTTSANENLQLTFKNNMSDTMQISFSGTEKQSIPGVTSVDYEGCEITGLYSMSGEQVSAYNSIFQNGVYTDTARETSLTDCTVYTGAEPAVYVCSSATTGESYTVRMMGCAFWGNDAPTSAVMIGTAGGDGNAYDVILDNCACAGFTAGEISGYELFDCGTTENTKVTVDGALVFGFDG